MGFFGKIREEISGPLPTMAFGALFMPAAVLCLLVAAGLYRPHGWEDVSTRWFAFDLGTMFGAFGIWAWQLGLPVWLSLLCLPKKLLSAAYSVLANPWALPAGTAALAAYAAWTLRASFLAQDFRMMLFSATGVYLLFLSARALLRADLDHLSRKLVFGESSMDPETIPCAPGGEIYCVLKLAKKAQSVEAALEYYGEGEGDGPDRTVPAEVAPAELLPEGWGYKITAKLPADARADGDNFWQLSAKAKGAGGLTCEATADIELRER